MMAVTPMSWRAVPCAGVVFVATAAFSVVGARGPRLADATIPKTPALFLETRRRTAQRSTRSSACFKLPPCRSVWKALPPVPSTSEGHRPVSQTVRLNGERLGAALDTIGRANPHFRWMESDGRVIVRGVPDDRGLLSQQVEHFAITNAGPRAALQALITALDPARNRTSVWTACCPHTFHRISPPSHAGDAM